MQSDARRRRILSAAQVAESYWYAGWLRAFCNNALPSVTTQLRNTMIHAFTPDTKSATASSASLRTRSGSPSFDDSSVTKTQASEEAPNEEDFFEKHGLVFHPCSEAKSFEYICEKMAEAHDEYLELCPQVADDEDLKYQVITAANIVTDILSYTLIVDSAARLQQGYHKLLSLQWSEHGAEVLRVENNFHCDAEDFGSCRHLRIWIAIHLSDKNILLPVVVTFYLEPLYQLKARRDLPFDFNAGHFDWPGADTAVAEPYENVIVRRQLKVSLQADKKVWSEAAAFSIDGERLVTGCSDSAIRIWNVASGVCLQTWVEHRDIVTSVVCSPDGIHFASASGDSTAKIWDLNLGKVEKVLSGHDASVLAVVYHPDGSQLATGSADKSIRVWAAESGKCQKILTDFNQPVSSLIYVPNGSCLGVGCYDRSIQIWGTSNWEKVRDLKGHRGPVTTVAIHPDGKLLVSGSQDHSIKFWDWWDSAAQEASRTLLGHKDAIGGVAFSADWERLASCSLDMQVRVWAVSDGTCLQILGGQDAAIHAVACSPFGDHFATCSKDETIRIWGCR
jgi:WD40 repeat protein